jgi:type VI secretion system secreted protein Hcp
MAYQVYITVTGAKQGVFKGGSTQKGREGKIHAIAASYGVVVPRDAISGLATGKRVEKPITFSLEWDGCSPQFFAAAYTNESLTSVLFEYFSAGKDGIEKLDHTVKLSKASIIDINESYAANRPDGGADGRDIQTVSLAFQTIEVTSNISGMTAVDDWKPTV